MGKVRDWISTVFPEGLADAEPLDFAPDRYTHQDAVAQYRFSGDRFLTMPTPDTSKPVTKRMLRGVRAMWKADDLASKITKDENLSDIGRQRKLARELSAPLAEAQKYMGSIASRRKALAARVDQAYALGEPTDAERAEDVEIRQAMRVLPEADRKALVSDMNGGKHPQIVRALLRSPVPVPGFGSDMLQRAWRAGVDNSNPDVAEAHELDAELAAAEMTMRRAADLTLATIGADTVRDALLAQGATDPGLFKVKLAESNQPNVPPAPFPVHTDANNNPFIRADIVPIDTARAAK
jgi:hypothetical protein